MKRKLIIPILCALVMVGASSGVSAVSWYFGTATTDLTDFSATAIAPIIDNRQYSLEYIRHADIDVLVVCEFTDQTTVSVAFSFYFLLTIDLWQENPPEYIEHWGSHGWSESNEDSRNWQNFPVVHSEPVKVNIHWWPPIDNRMYKCTLDVYIINICENVTDTDSESWFITCVD